MEIDLDELNRITKFLNFLPTRGHMRIYAMELCEIWGRKTTKYSNKKEEKTKKRHWICPIEQNKPEREKEIM